MKLSELLFSPAGRVPRSIYWLYLVANWVITLVVIFLDAAINDGEPGPLTFLFSILLLYPGIVINLKRLHDRNRSGWALLYLLVPFVNLVLLIELLFLRGTVGENRFGPEYQKNSGQNLPA